jgi:hypothetical protein
LPVTPTPTRDHLIRGLGLLAATSIVVGGVIGTGVFLKARVMTCNVSTPGMVIAVDPTIHIQHSLEPGPNLYEKLNELAQAINSRPKPIQAEVIEASAAQPSLSKR